MKLHEDLSDANKPERTKQEIEQCVILTRLYLNNRMLPCGPKAVRELCRDELITPLPSERTIARILARNGLTHNRTGFYD
jgi:putative transposase